MPVTTYRFTYPDGPVNAEALLADPKRERLWVISKEDGVGGVYALPSPMSASRTPMEAEKVGTARSQVTDAAMAPGGKRFVVRDYLSAEVFDGKPPRAPQARFGLPLQPQGEAVTWTADGKGLIVASEKSGELIQVDIPRTALGTDGGIAGVLPRVAGFDIYPYARIAAVALAALIALIVLRKSAPGQAPSQVARASGRAVRLLASRERGHHVVDRAGERRHVGRIHRGEHRHAQLVAPELAVGLGASPTRTSSRRDSPPCGDQSPAEAPVGTASAGKGGRCSSCSSLYAEKTSHQVRGERRVACLGAPQEAREAVREVRLVALERELDPLVLGGIANTFPSGPARPRPSPSRARACCGT